MVIVLESHFGNISKHTFVTALISKSRISLPESLGSRLVYTSCGKSKLIIGRSGSSQDPKQYMNMLDFYLLIDH